MRRLALMGFLLVTVLGGCVTSDARIAEPEHGPAWDELRGVHEVYVLPIKLPDELVNVRTMDVERWRSECPMSGARYVADGVVEKTQGRIKALSAIEKPKDGIYIEVVIKYLDIGTGDRTVFNSTGSRAGWSRVQANINVMDAKGGALAAKLAADQSSGTGDMWEADMKDIGRQLGEWLDKR